MSIQVITKSEGMVPYEPIVDVVPDEMSTADYLDKHEDRNLADLTTNLVYEIRRAVRSKPALLVLRMHKRYPFEKGLFQGIQNKCVEIFGNNLGEEMFDDLLKDTKDMLAEEGLCLINDTTGNGDTTYSVDRLPEREASSPLRQKLEKKRMKAMKMCVPGQKASATQFVPTITASPADTAPQAVTDPTPAPEGDSAVGEAPAQESDQFSVQLDG